MLEAITDYFDHRRLNGHLHCLFVNAGNDLFTFVELLVTSVSFVTFQVSNLRRSSSLI